MRRHLAVPALLSIAIGIWAALTLTPPAAWPLGTMHRSAVVPRCAPEMLVEWINTTGSAAAGNKYYDLEFTNESTRSCALGGYPDLAAVNLAGRVLGRSSSHGAQKAPAAVLVHVGASVIGVVQIADVTNFPAARCAPASAAGLRVTLPGEFAAKVIAFPFKACSDPGPSFLFAQALREA